LPDAVCIGGEVRSDDHAGRLAIPRGSLPESIQQKGLMLFYLPQT